MSPSFSAARRLAVTTFLLALGASAGCGDPMTVLDAAVADAGDASTPAIDAEVEDDAAVDGGTDLDSCVPSTCVELELDCDSVDDGCGGTLECGTCTAPQTCGGDGTPNVCGCTPTTCEAEGASCETIDDGCGGTLDCGTCTAPQTCGGDGTPNVCGCTPAICTTGVDCGEMDDGCGGTVDCGGCTGTDSCAGAGTPNECGCTPTTCEDEDATCGNIPDGCGGTLTCGSCTSPQTCGGGGFANVCGEGPCMPTSCAAEGLDCGTISDGCESTLDCGTCSGTDTCGGGGPANLCGCTPMSTATACAGAGLECGMVGDGCGGTVDCGGCVAPETCSATNLCVCVPSNPIAACGTRECGTVGDGCGGTHACGTCGSDEVCNGAGACECVPSATCGSRVCGTLDDGCGGALDCGTCTGVREACNAIGACECTPFDPIVACGGRVCGTVANGCGGTYDCGTCTGTGETCDASGACACIPEPDTTACAAASAECGTVVNNCGATTGSCGACGATETCTANECVMNPLTITSLDLRVLAHGAMITITGTNLDTATDVSIDGAMQAIASTAPTTLVFRVDDATSVGLVRSLTVSSPGGMASTNVTVIHLVIDELDSDTDFGVDTREFVELETGVAAAVDLTGYHLALVDGATDLTYRSFPLGTSDGNGRFVIGHGALTPAPEVIIGDDTLQNGADAAVIVQVATAFPTDTPVADLDVVIDAVVYGETPDSGLLDALLGVGPERVQRAEGFGENGPDNDSIQRCSPARLDGRAFSILATSPRVVNACL